MWLIVVPHRSIASSCLVPPLQEFIFINEVFSDTDDYKLFLMQWMGTPWAMLPKQIGFKALEMMLMTFYVENRQFAVYYQYTKTFWIEKDY